MLASILRPPLRSLADLCDKSSTGRRRSRRRGALLRRLPLRGLPLRGLARRLLRRGLRLRLCLLRHSALLAMMRLAVPHSRGSTARHANMYSTTVKTPNPARRSQRRTTERQALIACVTPIDRRHRALYRRLADVIQAFSETRITQGFVTHA